eukprot:CAMPEP_0176261390 /NCGR_PEP_ID=MMETSP0121_2-20121125/40073_1 /TAXON_ID=160619 /ORGANISM="Kryptoperidinium foliaceum, Strain CCMP 1326" /LENGTH=193 /DNA_ID=CAMNT_0017601329 /DNA_START=63 /DNA_END=644 /DNA_ORIENTATION=+
MRSFAVALFSFPALAAAYPPSWACAVTQWGQAPAVTMSAHAKEGHEVKSAQQYFRGAQKVKAVGGDDLQKFIDGDSKESMLVTFYAPWCGHCKHFVLSDGHGNAEKAPLELLNKDIRAAKGPTVVKFDVTASQPPSVFQVQFVPMIVLLKAGGSYEVFKANPNDLESLKTFALGAATGSNATASLAQVGAHRA